MVALLQYFRSMDVHQLKSFKTIVEKESFQEAAKELNYSLSAISYQMQQLENELNFSLFEKIGRRMHPTEQALKMIPHIKRIEEEVQQIKLLNTDCTKIEGSLTISVSDSLVTYILQPALKKFIEKAPNVLLKLKVKNCYEIQRDIIKNEIDLGIHYQVDGYGPQIKTVPIKDFKVGLMASPQFPKKEMDFSQWNQEKGCALINSDSNGVYQKAFKEELKKRSIAVKQHIELWSIEATKRSIMSQIGISYLPHFVVEEELKGGKIIEIPVQGFLPTITMIAAYHHQKWISPAMQLFLTILQEQMEEDETV
ncbi:DNA-binding transcriptional LysR family regulator [Myroides gitamensis]|uniref:HTH-type transcriptional activator CmpR n=2 Tax=Myroides odoratus TaxID=256 RepID=A0A378RNU6_MYROD|nr:DNA-binding transcriptional LysR family regulator [Myroides gitamensis]STZ27961.1 HTH-type transcriptional activator CmpR [Myroides odoratus]